MLALIDGDIAAYRAASACQREMRWSDDDEPTIYADPKDAAQSAIKTVGMWAEQVDATKVLVCLTGSGNFRKAVWPLYKANRTGPKPVALNAVREALATRFNVAMVDGLEADDLIGLSLTSPRMAGKVVAVTIDKDLRGVPGLHYNPLKDRHPVYVSPDDADALWMTQTLSGDTVDGYPGCPGVGSVGAAEAVSKPFVKVPYDHEFKRGPRAGTTELRWRVEPTDDVWACVRSLYVAAGLTEDHAICMARLSRILRDGDYDKRGRKVRLWHPGGCPELLSVA